MRIKDQFILQEIADEYIVVPVAEEADRLHGIIKLNETGAFLWKCLSQKSVTKEDLEQSLLSHYAVDQDRAATDVDTFIVLIDSFGCIEK